MEPKHANKAPDDTSCDVLTESFHLDSNSTRQCEEIVSSLTCDQCSCDDLSEKAASFCVDCVEYMCHDCNKHHQRNKYTRHHKLLQGNDVPENTKEFKRMKELTKCVVHPSNDISAICVDHDALLCVSCMTKSHRNCEQIEDIDEYIGDAALESELNELMEEVGYKIPKVKQEKEAFVECLETESDKTLQAIDETANALKAHVEEHANELTEKMMASVILEKCKLTNNISRCECLQNSTNSDKKLFELSKMFGTPKERLIAQKRTYDFIKKASNEIKTMAESRPVNIQHNASFEIRNLKSEWSVTFKAKEITDDLLSAEIQLEKSSEEFADTEETERREEITLREPKKSIMVNKSTQVALSEYADESIESEKTEREAGVEENITPKMQGNVHSNAIPCNVRSDTDTLGCFITGICVLECGTTVLTDFNNKKLKILNTDLILVAAEPLPGHPVDICVYKTEKQLVENKQIRTYRVAVCFHDMKRIFLYHLEGTTISPIGGFPTKLYATSVTKCRGHLGVMFSDEPWPEATNSDRDVIEMQVRRENGSIFCELDDFDFDHTMHGPCKVRSAGRKLYVCERGQLSVIDADLHENHVSMSQDWYYKGRGRTCLSSVTGIAMDNENWLYICDSNAKNIHRVSKNDFRNNKVLIDLQYAPASLAFDKRKKSLIVGYVLNDNISVFKLD